MLHVVHAKMTNNPKKPTYRGNPNTKGHYRRTENSKQNHIGRKIP